MINFDFHALRTIAFGFSSVFLFPPSGIAKNCTFRGEIVLADDYGKVVVERVDPVRADQPLGPHAPLFPGDTLVVQGDQVVWIRDRPHGEIREITAGDGRVKIGHPETCDTGRGFLTTLEMLFVDLSIILQGPVVDQPVATFPERSEEAPTRALSGIRLSFTGEQLISSDLESLGVYWAGMAAEVTLKVDDRDRASVLSMLDGDMLSASASLSRKLHPGDKFTLKFRSSLGEVTRAVHVVPPYQLPKPKGVEDLANLSETEATIYAIWLATKGPPEWHLQAMSLLSNSAETDYMAWKVLRALHAKVDK